MQKQPEFGNFVLVTRIEDAGGELKAGVQNAASRRSCFVNNETKQKARFLAFMLSQINPYRLPMRGSVFHHLIPFPAGSHTCTGSICEVPRLSPRVPDICGWDVRLIKSSCL